MVSQLKTLATVFLTVLLDMLGFGILIPVMPFLFTEPNSAHYILPLGTTVNEGYVLLGLLVSLFSLSMFITAPILGELSDIYGRKKVLTASVSGNIISYFVFGMGVLLHSIPLLFLSRIIGGIASGGMVVAQAAIADISKPEDRSKNFGLTGAAFGIGFIAGPFLGGRLADPTLISWFSTTTPFFFAALLSLINLIFVVFFFPETLKKSENTQRRKITVLKAIQNIKRALTLHSLRPLFITNFLFQSGFAFYIGFSSVFFLTRFGFNEGEIGNYFAYVGLCIVFTQMVTTRIASRYFTEKQIFQNAIFVISLSIFIISSLYDSMFLYMIVPFFATAMGLAQANMMALISRAADASVQGEVLGINGSVSALATSIPPLLAGILAASFAPSTPLVIAATVIFCAGLYFLNHLRTIKLQTAISRSR